MVRDGIHHLIQEFFVFVSCSYCHSLALTEGLGIGKPGELLIRGVREALGSLTPSPSVRKSS